MRRRSDVGRLFRRRRSPFWWADYVVGGKRVRESTGTTSKKDAVVFLEDRIKTTRAPTYVGPAADEVTVSDLLAALRSKYEVEDRPSLRTLRGHIAIWQAALGHERAMLVDEAALNRVVADWKKAGYAPATIDKLLGTLRRAYRVAVKDRKLGTIPSFPRIRFFNTRESFTDWPTVLALLEVLRRRDPDVADLAEWGARTGMRKGESSKLSWAGYDAETGMLTLPGRAAKTGRPRAIPILEELADILERRLTARRADCNLIFHRDGERIVEFRKAWATACKSIGLVGGIAGLTFHDLRRVGLRNLIRAGVEQTVAMEISGHTTISTFKRYNITDETDLREAVQKASAYTKRLATGSRKVTPIRKQATTA